MAKTILNRFLLLSLILMFMMALSAMAVIDWNNFRVFSGTTAPYAANGPGCRGFGGGGTANSVGQNCPGNNSAYDLGAVWVDMDPTYLAWKIAALNLTNAGICGGSKNSASSGANQWGVTVEFNSDSNTSTGCRMPLGEGSNDMCYPGADYRFYVYGDNSTQFEIYNRSLAGCGSVPNACFQRGNVSVSQMYNLSFSATCSGSAHALRIAVNRSAITSLVGMTFQTNSLGGGTFGPVDMLGGFDSDGGFADNIMMGGSKDMMFEGQHPCRTITSSSNCTSSSNVSGQIYSCFWDSFPQTCNPDFRNGIGGAGMTCSDFCGACMSSANCTSGGKGKCQVVIAPPNMPTGVTPFETDKMCVEDMTKFVQGSGSCDDDCKYCYSANTCGNSSFPSAMGSGAGCQWVTDTQFGKSWCDLATASYDFTCSVTNFAKCLNQTGCEAVSGNWSANFNYCYNASAELCYDGTDNDGDSSIDCVDSDCSKDPACGGNIDVLTGGFGTLDPYEAMKKSMFQDMAPGAPIMLSPSASTPGLRGDLDVLGFSLKDMGTSLGMGLDVRNMSLSLLCGGTQSGQYFFVVDSDKNLSTGCTINISGTNYTGFEYKFEYIINNNGTNGPSEIRRGYRCFNGAFSLYGAKLAGAPAEENFGNLPVSCQASVAIMAVDKTDMGNPQGGIRFMAASADNLTALNQANDTNLGNNNEGIYYTAGTVDFKPTNCFENPMACGTAFSMIGGGKFMPFEDCFLSSGDEDLDGLTNCADSDCSMAPWCSGTDYTTGDTTAPTVQSNKVDTFNDFAVMHWVTNEPSNGTITFHASSCASNVATYTFYELGNPAMTADDYRPWHDLPIKSGRTDSLGAPVTLVSNTLYYYKLIACDRAGNCAYSGCLNFTTAASAANVQYKFDFVPPANPLLNDMAMRIWNGTSYINVTQGDTTNTSYMNNATLKFDNPVANWSIDLEGIDMSQASDFNLSDAFNITELGNTTYMGMQNLKWTEIAQGLGADSLLLVIPEGGDRLRKCNENNLSDCSDVTNADGVEKVAGGTGYANTTWRIPTSLGFSVYTAIEADNTTTVYNLTFTNQSTLVRTVASGANATYNLSVRNENNVTRMYNLTLVTTSGASSMINRTTMMQVNITNGTTYTGVLIDVNSSVSGVYYTYILATLYNNATIVLNSSDDNIIMVTQVDATAPTVTLNTQNNSWTGDERSIFNFTVVDEVSSTATCNLYINGDLRNASLSATNNTATLITSNTSVGGGAYAWYVNCTDLYSNVGTSTPRVINVDKIEPVVSLVSPANNTWSTSATPSFTFNYTDASTASCRLYVGGVAMGTNSSVINNTNTAIPANASLSQGSNSWYVNCTDQGTNIGSSTTQRVFVDAVYPTSLVNNVNGVSSGYSTNNATLTINFTANDTYIINWTLAVYNSTYSLLNNWSENNANISAVDAYIVAANGTYYVNLTVRDNATNVNTTSFTVYVDQISPVINSLAISSITSSGATLTVNATDSISGIANCTYSGAGSGNLTLSSGLYTATLSGLTASTAYTVNVTCIDNATNTQSNTTSLTTIAASSSSSSSSSSGGGSTGASGGVSNGAIGQFEQRTWTSVNAGETATVSVPNGEIGVTEVSFELSKTLYGVWMKVAKIDSLPSEVKTFNQKVYRYIEVTKSLSFKESDFKNAQIDFKVKKTWLTENKLGKENVALYRYVDSKWTELKTTLGTDDGTYLHYSASTPGFSYFIIGQKASVTATPLAIEPVAEVPAVEPIQETEEASAVEVTPTNTKMWIFGVILLLIILAVVAMLWKKR